ncbi:MULTISPECIES: DUF4265 domain-containing protein [unclassified Streptomyces]|uniref:DUF4265 domain-containing protein n=1 Tax=unclassified Streptomyces TaxID=2593676 RepID=UPI00225B5D78|nr:MULTISPECIES: DUF4265 domain-containing protein [unclassified Streptomyces]MCX5443799.1 DUF4265 domain-containing protein [Streptomyces sp. NBC_00063]WUB90863.1 DUF4265 domain-containing protein [Streptomyces sp. NBC_00569]WUB99176.1 DUF4265 domain-containing protein [Streptomyces sp. NBC_00569]
MNDAAGALVKVRFALDQDEEGWPPVGGESLWAVDVGDELVRIDNVPFFVRDLACGDIVRTRVEGDGRRYFQERVQWSGNCTVRVIPFSDGPSRLERQAVLDLFAPLGVSGEGVDQFGMVALNVPANADFMAIRELLTQGSTDGRWDYEEGCVGDAWETATS